MVKKKKKNISPLLIKGGTFLFLVLVTAAGSFSAGRRLLFHNDYFKVKSIATEPLSLQEGDLKGLSYFKGKNIFLIDLEKLQNKILSSNPQLTDLKITKVFPNQLHLKANVSPAVAYAQVKNKIISLDERGVVLSFMPQETASPLILGMHSKKIDTIEPGITIKDKGLTAALKIIEISKRHKKISEYGIAKINIENLSAIQCYLSNDLRIIIDASGLEKKVSILNLILEQNDLNLREVNYVDLRFQDPILGKKNEKVKNLSRKK